ncbi:MAG: hypothetical protein JO035_12820, partial [Betaproteobacteria bacterium]|nr:hypothetical protein [Betaproteobacteria bacterium]
LVDYFNHDLKLVATGNILVQGGIYITGNLALRADASVSEAASRTAAPSLGDGLGGVTIQNLSTTDPLEIRALNIVVGQQSAGANFPVEFLNLSAGNGVAAAGSSLHLDATLRAGIPTTETLTSTSNSVTGGTLDVFFTKGLTLNAGTVNAQSNGGPVRSSAVAAITGTDVAICGVNGCGASAPFNASNFVLMKAGNSTADNTGGGAAQASSSALILGSNTMQMSVGGSIVLVGGNATASGTAQPASIAVIDPIGPLELYAGGSVVLQAGTKSGSTAAANAGILNQGPIHLFIGANQGYSFVDGTTPVSLPGGLLLIGGSGSGVFSGSTILQQLHSFTTDPVKVTASVVTYFLSSGNNFADASVISGLNIFDESLLNYVIFATNTSTSGTTPLNTTKDIKPDVSPACQ